MSATISYKIFLKKKANTKVSETDALIKISPCQKDDNNARNRDKVTCKKTHLKIADNTDSIKSSGDIRSPKG